jgi:hypothetical protein
MLDDEVGVHEIERRVVEGKTRAEVAGDEAVERGVLLARLGIDVHPDELGDSVPVGRQPRRPPAAGVQHTRAVAQCLGEQPRLDVDMRALERDGRVYVAPRRRVAVCAEKLGTVPFENSPRPRRP